MSMSRVSISLSASSRLADPLGAEFVHTPYFKPVLSPTLLPSSLIVKESSLSNVNGVLFLLLPLVLFGDASLETLRLAFVRFEFEQSESIRSSLEFVPSSSEFVWSELSLLLCSLGLWWR